MKKVFNVIGACTLMCSLFMFSACEETYDEEELNRDIEKKLAEMKAAELERTTTKKIAVGADTLYLPVRVKPIVNENYNSYFPEESAYYLYQFNPEDKEDIINSLKEQTAATSEFGNFMLDRGDVYYGSTYLKDALSTTLDDDKWLFVEDDPIRIMSVEFDLENNTFRIVKDYIFNLDENHIVQPPTLGLIPGFSFGD